MFLPTSLRGGWRWYEYSKVRLFVWSGRDEKYSLSLMKQRWEMMIVSVPLPVPLKQGECR